MRDLAVLPFHGKLVFGERKQTLFARAGLRQMKLHTRDLLEASQDLRYLLNRGYKRRNLKTVLKFVGDRYTLNKSQRNLLSKAVFSDRETKGRQGKLVNIEEIKGCTLGIDGYNVLVTLESAVQGKAIILADDGLVRDIAGKSSRYRPGDKTVRALDLIMGTLREYLPREVVVLFDEKMSKSLLLARRVTEMMDESGLVGGASTSKYPDKEILQYEIISTSDSGPIDEAKKVFDLAGYVIRRELEVELLHLM